MNKFYPLLIQLTRWGLGLVLIAWVVWKLDWATLWASLRQVHLVWVSIAVMSFVLSLWLKLARWRWLLQKLPSPVEWLPLARALFLGQAVNIIGIGRWGEIARLISLQPETRLSSVSVLASIAAEKLLDTLLLGLSGLLWLWFVFQPANALAFPNFLGLSLAGAVALGGITLFGQPSLSWVQRYLEQHPSRVNTWLARRAQYAMDGLAGLTDQRLAVGSYGLSVLIWGVMLVTNVLLLQAFELPLTFNLALSVLVMGYVGGVANLTPGNIGPLHWAFMFALTLFGVDQPKALAYAFVMHALITIPPLVIALILNGWDWRVLVRRPPERFKTEQVEQANA